MHHANHGPRNTLRARLTFAETLAGSPEHRATLNQSLLRVRPFQHLAPCRPLAAADGSTSRNSLPGGFRNTTVDEAVQLCCRDSESLDTTPIRCCRRHGSPTAGKCVTRQDETE